MSTSQHIMAAGAFLAGIKILLFFAILLGSGNRHVHLLSHSLLLFVAFAVFRIGFRRMRAVMRRLGVSIPDCRSGWRKLAGTTFLALTCGFFTGPLLVVGLFPYLELPSSALRPWLTGTMASRFVSLFPLAVILIGVVLTAAAYRRSARQFRAMTSQWLALCPRCSYPMDGLNSDRCPECGGPIRMEQAS